MSNMFWNLKILYCSPILISSLPFTLSPEHTRRIWGVASTFDSDSVENKIVETVLTFGKDSHDKARLLQESLKPLFVKKSTSVRPRHCTALFATQLLLMETSAQASKYQGTQVLSTWLPG